MSFLVVFIITILIGQALSIFIGLLIEQQYSAYAGLITFIALYFAVFWVGWKIAVRITEPGTWLGSRLGSGAEK